jgi:hypothetical protein
VGGVRRSTSPPKVRYAVADNSVIKLAQPGELTDALTEVLRDGVPTLLAHTVEVEVANFLCQIASNSDKQTEDGRHRLVRHDPCLSAKLRPGSVPWLCASAVVAIETLTAMSASVSPRQFCRPPFEELGGANSNPGSEQS